MIRSVLVSINEELSDDIRYDKEFQKAIGYASLWGNVPIVKIFVNKVGEIDATYYRNEDLTTRPSFVMSGFRHNNETHWTFHS